LGFLVYNKLVAWLIAFPQQSVRARLPYKPSRLSRAASLGYMASAHKPLD
jgi:hypothetical protein